MGFLFVSLRQGFTMNPWLASDSQTPPKCWDSKCVPPCLATLGFLSPSPVLHSHHRSQTTHTNGLSWPLLPKVCLSGCCSSQTFGSRLSLLCSLWRKERTSPLYMFLYKWWCLFAFYVFPRSRFCGAPLAFLGTAAIGLGRSPE